jgi:N-acetylated-alpha-linked acidic dipeptidase
VIGTALLRLADGDVLPFEFRGAATTFREYVEELEKLDGAGAVDFSELRAAVMKLTAAADSYEAALKRLHGLEAKALEAARPTLAHLNEILYTTERAFRHEAGLPRREWFKHLVYAPGFYTGYGVKTLPGIREAIEQRQMDEARQFVPIVAGALSRLSDEIERATEILDDLTRSSNFDSVDERQEVNSRWAR